jgi:hypothetical protein
MRKRQNSLSRKKNELFRKSARATKSIAGAAIPDLGKALGYIDAVRDTAGAINAGKDLAKAYGRAGKSKIKRGINKAIRRLPRF